MEEILIRQITLPNFFFNHIVLKTSMRLAATIVGRNLRNVHVRSDKIREKREFFPQVLAK